jgi:hypothetical protein
MKKRRKGKGRQDKARRQAHGLANGLLCIVSANVSKFGDYPPPYKSADKIPRKIGLNIMLGSLEKEG